MWRDVYNKTWRRNTITEVERCIQQDLEEKHHNGGGEMLYNKTWRRNTITEVERCYTTRLGGEHHNGGGEMYTTRLGGETP